jgi:hypothetical protein
MSIKRTGDRKKNICIKNTRTQITRAEETKHIHIRKESQSSNQIIGLDGESKSNESGFCCC